MFSKKLFPFLLSFAFLSLPNAFAQSAELEMALSGPESISLHDAVVVVVELTDPQGLPVSGIEPEISFDPGDAVSSELLYDCENPEWYDHCKANHRGVAGIFELHFVMEQSPVLVEVLANGLRQGIRLDTLPSPLLEKEMELTAVSDFQVAPAQIQAGPSLSFWIMAFPFLILMSVVSYFVVSTTR